MTITRSSGYLINIVNELRKLSEENEWVEFKKNNSAPEKIGEYISALANSAALAGKVNAYMLWGIDNSSQSITGTTFKPDNIKIGNEELENWLLRLITPKVNFYFYTLDINGFTVVLLEIGRAFRHPVRFKDEEFIRIGSYKKKLKNHPESKIWQPLLELFEKH